MRADYADDLMLSNHLEESKSDLIDYFNANYENTIPMPSLSSPPAASVQSSSVAAGSPQKSFTARYRRKEKVSINKLEEYLKLPAEDFDACNPIHWWIGRRAQFPNLYCMARDILCIPGALLVLYRSLFQTHLQILPLLLKGYFRVVMTQFPSGVPVSVQTPSALLCLLRSGCILPAPKLISPSIIELQDHHPVTPF